MQAADQKKQQRRTFEEQRESICFEVSRDAPMTMILLRCETETVLRLQQQQVISFHKKVNSTKNSNEGPKETSDRGGMTYRTAGPPYVTDTNYTTPPPLCCEEQTLRDALLRWDLGAVDEILDRIQHRRDVGNHVLWLSGGVVDVALVAGRQMLTSVESSEPTKLSPLSLGCSDSRVASRNVSVGPFDGPLSSSTSIGGVTRRYQPSGFHAGGAIQRWAGQPGDSDDSEASSDDETSAPSLMRVVGGGALATALPPRSPLIPSTLSSASVSRASAPVTHQQQQLRPAHVLSTTPFIGLATGTLPTSSKRRRQSAIVVPASSLPVSMGPPSLLCDSSVGDDNDDGDEEALMDPLHPLTRSTARKGGLVSAPKGLVSPFMGTTGAPSRPELTVDDAIAAVIRRLLAYPHLDTKYCGPVSVAVRLDNITCVRLLLRDQRFDPNTGCPLRVAVLCERTQCFEELIRCPRINPNRGAPLLYAVRKCNLWAVRWLCDHHATQVNRYATGTSTTPLLCAIRMYCDCVLGEQQAGSHDTDMMGSSNALLPSGVVAGAEGVNHPVGCGTLLPAHVFELVRVLVLHPRVDLNKGFAETPLQIAVAHGLVDVTRLLLSRPNIAPNRAIGLFPAPLQIAVENEDLDLIEILLADPRTYATEEMVNRLEKDNQLAILQVIANHSQEGLRMGFAWSMRCLTVVSLGVLLWLASLLDLVFVIGLSAGGVTGPAIVLLIAQVAGCSGTTWILLRRRVNYSGIPWYSSLIPFAPFPESIMALRLGRWLMSDVYDLYARQRNFELFFSVAHMRCVAWVLPSFATHFMLLMMPRRYPGKASGTTSALCCLLLLLSLVAFAGLRRLRLPSVFTGSASSRLQPSSAAVVVVAASTEAGPISSSTSGSALGGVAPAGGMQATHMKPLCATRRRSHGSLGKTISLPKLPTNGTLVLSTGGSPLKPDKDAGQTDACTALPVHEGTAVSFATVDT